MKLRKMQGQVMKEREGKYEGEVVMLTGVSRCGYEGR